jgi:type IV secretory pathway VirJ component
MVLRARLLPPVAALIALILTITAPRPSASAPIEIPSDKGGSALAVLYSGDGGWGPLDQGVARQLADNGVPTLGVDSLRYFLIKRSPQQAADDLAVSLRRYEALWNRRDIVLVGYSFGANALPAIIPALPADLRSHVKSVVLIGTGPTGDLTFRPPSWFDHFGPDAYPVVPAIAALKGLKTTCVYGDQERHDICASLPADIAQVRLPGGHHFNGDYVGLGQAVLRAAG